MSITKQTLVDDLELRLTKANPSADDKFTKKLLEHYIDIARDTYIGEKLRKMNIRDIRIDPAYIIDDDNLSLTAAGRNTTVTTSGYLKTKYTATLTSNVLNISHPKQVDMGLVSGVVCSAGGEKEVVYTGISKSSISNVRNNSFLVARPLEQYLTMVFDGGNRTVDKALTGAQVSTVLNVHWFDDGEIWLILTDPITNKWQLWYSTDNWNTFTKYEASPIAGTLTSASGASFTNDGEKILLFAGDYAQENGAESVRIYNGQLNANSEFTLTATQFKDITDISAIEIHSVEAYDSKTMFLGSNNSEIYISSDGYVDTDVFEKVTIDSANLGDVVSISFASPLHGTAIIDGVGLYYTADGGATWAAQTAIPVAAADFSSSAPINTEVKMKTAERWLVRADLQIYETLDNGTTWQSILQSGSTLGFYGEGIQFGTTPEIDWLFDNGEDVTLRSIGVGKEFTLNLKKVDSHSLSLIRDMTFSRPSRNSPTMLRKSGSSDTIDIEGLSQYHISTMIGSFRYVKEGSDYALTDAYGIALEDVDPIMDIAFETAFNALILNPHEDIVGDGNQDDDNNNHAN